MTDPVAALQKRLQYSFADRALLDEALTHRSASSRNNERLEYLGDSALNFIIAQALFAQRPKATEGQLSRLRASLVRGETLAEIARQLQLGDALSLGPGELKSGGHRRDSILADALEAVIGGVYLDAGFDTCRDFVLALFEQRLRELGDAADLKDPKTRLQEWLQGRGLGLPEYSVTEVRGEDHRQTFTVECRLQEPDLLQNASARSRRKAEQAAASRILKLLETMPKADHGHG